MTNRWSCIKLSTKGISLLLRPFLSPLLLCCWLIVSKYLRCYVKRLLKDKCFTRARCTLAATHMAYEMQTCLREGRQWANIIVECTFLSSIFLWILKWWPTSRNILSFHISYGSLIDSDRVQLIYFVSSIDWPTDVLYNKTVKNRCWVPSGWLCAQVKIWYGTRMWFEFSIRFL